MENRFYMLQNIIEIYIRKEFKIFVCGIYTEFVRRYQSILHYPRA